MNSTPIDRLQHLFFRVLEMPDGARRRYLRELDAEDPALAANVTAMLAADAEQGTLLDRDLGEVAHTVLDVESQAPERIGAYRVREQVGRGGTSIVYRAEHEGLGREVALKVLRDAWISPDRTARFEREGRMLAQLSHPSIATLYEAGVAADGVPFFVMEYVDGTPLTTCCTEHQLDGRARIELFIDVCEAVRYAHQEALIHRDLKPSNILVSRRSGGQFAVRLLDFGIAQRLEEIDEQESEGRSGLRLMTPAYAAPEQIRGDRVGMYTDVYALGVILYQLLTDRLPFEPGDLDRAQIDALMRSHAPLPPSRRTFKGESLSYRPGFSALEWRDLDRLVAKAMHREVSERYGAIETLLQDLRRFLDGRPLESGPGTVWYRLRKFESRNRPAVAAAIVVGLLLLGLQVWHTANLAEARDNAFAEAERTERIQEFMLGLFSGGGEAAPAETLRVATLLDRGVREAQALDSEPHIQAELFETLGVINQELGDLVAADSLLQRALYTRRSALGADDPEVAQTLIALGRLRVEQAEFDSAEVLVGEALRLARQHLSADHPMVARAMTELGHALIERGEYEQAIPILKDATRLLAVSAPASPDLSDALTELANAHFYSGSYERSDSLNRIVLAMDRNLFGPRHPNVASVLVNLGAIQEQRGQHEAAEAYFRRALQIVRPYFGDDHPETASIMMILAQSMTIQERHEEALELLRPALQVREATYGPDHPRVATTLNVLGTAALRANELDQAERYFSRATKIYRSSYDGAHYYIGIGLSNLATVHARAGDFQRAEESMREALDLFQRTLGPDHLNTAIAEIKLGGMLVDGGRFGEAEEYLLSGHEAVDRAADESPWLDRARQHLLLLYDTTGNEAAAERYRSMSAGLADAER